MDWHDMPPLSALRAFAAYAEEGSVQAAGAALNVSHAAVSQQIRNLEGHLGLSLLDRSGRAGRLTAEGTLLAEALGQGFGGIAAAVATLTGADARRPLYVSTTPTFVANWLLPRLAEFRAGNPGIDIVIDPNPNVMALEPGGIDVSIRYGSGEWPGVEAFPLLRSGMVVVAAPDLVADKVIDGPEALADLPWLEEMGLNETSAWLKQHGVTGGGTGPRTGMPGNMALDAARAGQGVVATSRAWVVDDLRSGRLQLLFSEHDERGYYIVTRPGVARPPLAAFTRWLKRLKDWPEG